MKLIYTFLIGALLLTGCSPIYYSPNSVNAPMLSQRGETNLTLGGRGGLVEFQGAYGIGDNFGVMADGAFFIPRNEDNGDGGAGNFFEVGAGYFVPIADEHIVFDTYIIGGFGAFENHFPSKVPNNPGTTGKINANIMRFGIQPGIGYKSNFFEVGFNPRISLMSYSNIDGSLEWDGDQVAYLKDNKSNVLIEPAITLRVGVEKVKLQLQAGYSMNASNPDFKQDKSWISLGVNFRFK